MSSLRTGGAELPSVLLPGEPITPSAVAKEALEFSVQALTEVRTCQYDRAVVRDRMAQDTRLLDAILALFSAEREQADRSLTDLGQRPADERMARFFLRLLQRLKARGMAQEHSFECPLRQRHIADAMGLTPVHVNRVIGQFRRSGLMSVADGRVTVHRPADLRQVAGLR